MRGSLLLSAAVVLVSLAGCSSDAEQAVPPSTTVPRQSVITGPIVAPSVTVGPAEPATTGPGTTTPVDTQPVLPTLPPSPPGRTDPPVALACDAGLFLGIVAASEGQLPPGTGTDDPVCSGGWAAMVIGAPQQERFLAVFVAEPAGWRFVTLGSDAVCTDAGVPPEQFGPLGCALWETG